MAVHVERDGGVAVITLDRAEVLNAFDERLGREALAAVVSASADASVRCMVITGGGRAFSSGEDLAALADGYRRGEPPDLGRILTERYNPLVLAVRSAPKPVVAAVNGVAAGAGASLALACDVRIASTKAKLVLAFVRVGLVPDSGALWFLSRMVGTARTWQLATSGSTLDAKEACALGLFDDVLDEDGFEKGWRGRAAALAAGPTVALALTKELLGAASERSLDDQLAREARAQAKAGRSSDHMEGVRAFVDKREAKFEGR